MIQASRYQWLLILALLIVILGDNIGCYLGSKDPNAEPVTVVAYRHPPAAQDSSKPGFQLVYIPDRLP